MRSHQHVEAVSAFAAHYGFSYAFCNPRAGHEKGSVENKVGAMRRSLFVPVPQFDNVRQYNERLLGMSMGHSDKVHYRKGESQLALFEEDCFALSPLPDSRFSAVSYTEHKADKYGNVVLDGRHRYSTDPAYANRRLIVGAGAFDVDIYDREGAHIVTHERGWGDKPTESIEPVSEPAGPALQEAWRLAREPRPIRPPRRRRAMDRRCGRGRARQGPARAARRRERKRLGARGRRAVQHRRGRRQHGPRHRVHTRRLRGQRPRRGRLR